MRIGLKKYLESKKNESLSFDAEFSISKTYNNFYKKKKEKDEDDDDKSEGMWILEGYASTGDLDTQNSIIRETAIASGAKSLSKYQTLLFNHDMDYPIGKILLAEARKDKLFVKCSISKSEPDIWEKIKDGTLSKFSIKGFITDADEETIDDVDILVIKDMELVEASIVSIPANVKANVLNWYIEKAIQSRFSLSQNDNKNKEDLIVKDNSRNDKNRVEGNEEIKEDVKKSLIDQNENENVEQEKIVENEKETVVKTVSNEVNFIKEMLSVVEEIKVIAKGVVDCVDTVNKRTEEINLVKNELNSSLEEIKTVLKSLPVRKTSISNDVETDVRKENEEEVSMIEKSRKRVNNFDSLPPQEQLRQILADQFNS